MNYKNLLEHTNNFDFLRLLAALMVLYSHQRNLLGLSDPGLDDRLTPGVIGVCIFFVISGYLVTQSWQRDPNIFRFAFKRFLRIWPALFIVTCLAAFALGPLVSRLPSDEYLQHPLLMDYMKNLRLRMNFNLPGVFENNPFPNAVNGSTWTIPLEVRWYVILGIAGLVGIVRYPIIVLFAVIGLALYQFGYYHAETNPDRNYIREYGLFFCAGTLLWLYRDPLWSRKTLLLYVSVLSGIFAFFLGQHMLGVLIALAPLVVVVGEASTPILRRCGRFGDLSYGAYIYAFPVQQTLIWKFGKELPFSIHLIMTLVITFACAWLSWHLIEKRALACKRFLRFRRRTPNPAKDSPIQAVQTPE